MRAPGGCILGVRDDGFGQVILDEMDSAYDLKLVDLDQVLGICPKKPPMIRFIPSGRNAPAGASVIADTVSEVREIKHAEEKDAEPIRASLTDARSRDHSRVEHAYDSDSGIGVPKAWRELDPGAISGTLLILGQSDTGKSTFARWVVAEGCLRDKRVGWLDADVGQSTLGLPTTMNLAVAEGSPVDLPEPSASFFVGDTSPRRHMLPTLVGVHRLRERALDAGADLVVVDTTGLVAREVGGGALKEWKIELLRPAIVVAFEHAGELAHILDPLRKRPGMQLHVFPVSEEVRSRTREGRAARRREAFRKYFASASERQLGVGALPIYGGELISPHRLVALQSADGFALGLGVFLANPSASLRILTPLEDLSGVQSLRAGDLQVDPATGEEI